MACFWIVLPGASATIAAERAHDVEAALFNMLIYRRAYHEGATIEIEKQGELEQYFES